MSWLFSRTSPLAPTVLLGLLLQAVPIGCSSPRQGLVGDDWPWGPTEVEIHALSRFIQRDDEEILSVRAEFRDRDGDPTKFPGSVMIEVDPEGLPDEEEREFTFDLTDVKTNAEYWDHVTMMYRFTLKPDWDEPPLPSTPIRIRIKATWDGHPDLLDGITVRRGG